MGEEKEKVEGKGKVERDRVEIGRGAKGIGRREGES